jgi:D-lyxose ketol-isomerase
MKRSEINQALRAAMATLAEHHISLPPFAYWPPERWRAIGLEYDRVVRNGLGWDISDFGGDDFPRLGAVLFTMRNGNVRQPAAGTPYCEKIIVMLPGQRMPLHMHWAKTEDIINRAGGRWRGNAGTATRLCGTEGAAAYPPA